MVVLYGVHDTTSREFDPPYARLVRQSGRMYFIVPHKGKHVILHGSTLAALEEKCATLCGVSRKEVELLHNNVRVHQDVFTSFLSRSSPEFVMIEAKLLASPVAESRGPVNAEEVVANRAEPPEHINNANLLTSMIAAADARRRMEQSFENRKEIARREAAAADRLLAETTRNDSYELAQNARPDHRVRAPAFDTASDLSSSKYSRGAADTSFVDPVACTGLNEVRKQIPQNLPVQRELITVADIVRCRSFVDLRLEALSRMSADGIDFQPSCYLHFIRRDTKELIVTAVDYDALRTSIASKRDANHTGDDEIVMEWRLDSQPLQLAPSSAVRSADTTTAIQATSTRNAVPCAITPTISSAPRLRGQLKLVVQTSGIVGYIPFDRHYPPSFWMLAQHVGHITGIPPSCVEIEVLSDAINEVMVVKSDADVWAVCCLMDKGDPTLFAVDLRL